ncbi:amino acid adenylation domain-containing protein [Bradyrhizobium sp. GM5.1]
MNAGPGREPATGVVDRGNPDLHGLEEAFYLTPLQEGLVLHHAAATLFPEYLIRISGTIHAFNFEAWKVAWNRVVAHHPMLRTAIASRGQRRPLQMTTRHLEPDWELHEIPAGTAEDVNAAFEALKQSDRRRPMNLARPPLFRGAVMKLPNGKARFLWTYHHVILDAWSAGLVLDQVLRSYCALLGGAAADLPPSISFRNYAAYLNRQHSSRAETFWRGHFAGYDANAREFRAPDLMSTASGHYVALSRSVDSAATARLNRLSRRLGITIATLAAGCWALIKARCSGTNDLIIGMTVSDRPAEIAGIEWMAGLCIVTLPIRIMIDPEGSLHDWLRKLQDTLVAARDNGHLPLTSLHAIAGAADGASLFDSILVLENLPGEFSAIDGASGVAISDIDSEWYTHYPLTLMVAPHDELAIQLRYDSDRVEPSFAETLIEGFMAALTDSVLEAGGRTETVIRRLPGLPPYPVLRGPRQGANSTAVATTIVNNCACRGDQLAIATRERAISYRRLGEIVEGLVLACRRAGVRRGDVVAVHLGRTEQLSAGLTAVLTVGGVFLALDPAHPRPRHEEAIQRSGARWIMTDRHSAASFAAGGLPVIETDPPASPAPERKASILPPDPDDPAYVILTSGSTGTPKVVIVPHRALSNVVAALAHTPGFGPGDNLFALTTVAFDIAVAELLMPLWAGGSLTLCEIDVGLDPEGAIAALQRAKPAVVQSTPSVWRHLMRNGWEGHRKLRIWCGGEPLTRDLADALLSQCGELWNLYGPTETAVWSSAHRVARAETNVPVGAPLAQTTIAVMNADGTEAASGSEGEIWIGGAGVALGYLGDPDLSDIRFPFATIGDERMRVFRTGDRGRIDSSGQLHCLGRLDHQVKIRGGRVDPHEIENVLRRHPGVADAAVAAVHAEDGQVSALHAFVVADDDERRPARSDLMTHLRMQLPSYMVPARLVHVRSLPRTANGKIDRANLLRVEHQETEVSEPGFRSARPIVDIVLWIAAEVLGKPAPDPTMDFLAMGGNSISAGRMISRLNTIFGTSLPLRTVFEARTLGRLTDIVVVELDDRLRDAASDAPCRSLASRAPLTDNQRRLLFLRHLGAGAPYDLVAATRLEGPLDLTAVQASIDELVARHDSLRIRIVDAGGEPFQEIAHRPPISVQVVEIGAHCTLTDAISRHARDMIADRRRDDDFPLLAVRLLKADEQTHLLVLTIDHMIADAWSLQLLQSEFLISYERTRAGNVLAPRTGAVRFIDIANWQQSADNSARAQRDAATWSDRLKGAALAPFAADLPRAIRPMFVADDVVRKIRSETGERIVALSQRQSLTPFIVLTAALRVLLQRMTLQGAVPFITMLTGRDRPDFEDIVGFLARTAILYCEIAPDMSFEAVAKLERRALLDAWALQSAHLEAIVRNLGHERGSAGNPAFQIMIVMRDVWVSAAEPAAIRAEPMRTSNPYIEFDLVVGCHATVDGFDLYFSYDTGVFHKSTIERLADYYVNILDRLVEDSEMPIGRIPLASARERFAFASEFHGTELSLR